MFEGARAIIYVIYALEEVTLNNVTCYIKMLIVIDNSAVCDKAAKGSSLSPISYGCPVRRILIII